MQPCAVCLAQTGRHLLLAAVPLGVAAARLLRRHAAAGRGRAIEANRPITGEAESWSSTPFPVGGGGGAVQLRVSHLFHYTFRCRHPRKEFPLDEEHGIKDDVSASVVDRVADLAHPSRPLSFLLFRFLFSLTRPTR
jgi:hypothetical protein